MSEPHPHLSEGAAGAQPVVVTEGHHSECPCDRPPTRPRRRGEMLVTCPRCLRQRDRFDTLVTHACTDERACALYVRTARDRYRAALVGLIDSFAGPVGRIGLRDPDPEQVADWRVMRDAIRRAREALRDA